jgi:hypothetical protein
MRKLHRLGLASATAIGLLCLSAIGSVTAAGVASAAPKLTSTRLTGLTFAEASVSLPADSQAGVTAFCPSGDEVVGGGGYEEIQGMGEDMNGSLPYGGAGTGWMVFFNNEESVSTSGVAVAICAASASLTNYSLQYGDAVTIPAGGEAQALVTCPSGTVSLGGGAQNQGTGTDDAMDASAPYGTNGWRAYLSSSGSDTTEGYAGVVCATEPSGWAQVSSSYKSNPAGKATEVTVKCPAGTDVLGGGPFNSSADPTVTIGLTTSETSLHGWHSIEDNASSSKESVDEWGVCAEAKRASS